MVKKRSRGFWLSEVLASLWLLTFIAAAILALFVYLAKTSKLSNERASAELLADALVERGLRVGPPDWGLPEGQLGALQHAAVSSDGTALSYQVVASRLEKHRLGELHRLQVTVNWNTPSPAPSGVERGRGTLVRERLVYVEDVPLPGEGAPP